MLLPVTPAAAQTASFSVERTTWDIVGLRSNVKNNTLPTSPNSFPLGVKVCNTGDSPASNMTAVLTLGTFTAGPDNQGGTSTASNTLLARTGAASTDTATTVTRTVDSNGTIAAGACRQVYFEIATITFTNNPARALGAQRRYTVAIKEDGVTKVTHTGQLVAERLVRQNRNAILKLSTDAPCVSGTCSVAAGDTYKFTLLSKSAPNGYDQSSAFLNLPQYVYEILDVTTRFSAPAGTTVEGLYGDGCGWNHYWFDRTLDPLGPTPTSTARECLDGRANFSGGRIGGSLIRTTYTVRVRSDLVGSHDTAPTALIYDLSGGSFHYNADFNSANGGITTIQARQSADLSIAKSHPGAFVRGVGQTGTYTLNVANSGPSAAGAITVTDTLPAGLVPTAATGTGWAGGATNSCGISGQTVTCTRPAGAGVGALPAITITVSLNPGPSSAIESVTNVATVSQDSTRGDPNLSDNTARDVTTVGDAGEADLVVTNTPEGEFTKNGSGAYRVKVRNDGPEAISQPVVLTYTLPDGLSFASIAPATPTAGQPTWTCDPPVAQSVTCTSSGGSSSGGLAASSAAPDIVITVGIGATTDPIVTIADAPLTAPVDSYTGNNENVEASVSIDVADLEIFKSNPTGTFPITPADESPNRRTGTFTLTVENKGPDQAAAPITVTDVLPSALRYVSATGDGDCTHDPALEGDETGYAAGGTLTCTIGQSLPVGSTASIVVTVATPFSDQAGLSEQLLVNEATVDGQNSDPDVTNNEIDDVAWLRYVTDVKVTKSVSPATVAAGGNATWTVVVENLGPNPATGMVWEDTLPANMNRSGAIAHTVTGGATAPTADDCDWPDTNGTAVATFACVIPGNLPVNGTVTTTFVATPVANEASTTLKNSVEVFHDQHDTHKANNKASVTVTCDTNCLVPPSIHYEGTGIALNTTTFPEDRTVERTFNFRVVHPTSVSSAFSTSCGGGTKVSESLGDEFTVAVGEIGAGQKGRDGSVTCIFDDGFYDADSVASTYALRVTATHTSGENSISESKALDVTINNVAPSVTSLAIDPTPPLAGEAFVLTLSGVSDPSDADTDDGFRYRFDCGSGTFAPAVLSAMAALEFSCPNGLPGGTHDLYAFVADKDGGESEVAHLELTITSGADLAVDKQVYDGLTFDADDSLSATTGETVKFRLTVTNNGTADATNVELTDTLPSGLDFTAFTAASGFDITEGSETCTEATGTITCDEDSLADGASAWVEFTAEITATDGTVTNSAAATADEDDPTPGNDDDGVDIVVTPEADLDVIKTAGASEVRRGNAVVFTIAVTNDGPSAATNVVASDVIPAGFTYSNHDAGDFDTCTLTDDGAEEDPVVTAIDCELASLVDDETASFTLTLTVEADASGTLTNSAAAEADEDDPDGGDDDAGVEVILADLSVNKQVYDGLTFDADDSLSATTGDTVKFRLTVTNNGPMDATNVSLTDTLPSGLDFIAFTDASGFDVSEENGTCFYNELFTKISCGDPSMPDDASAWVEFTAEVTATDGTVTNTAAATADEDDPTPGNDDDGVDIVLTPEADLGVLKTADTGLALEGDDVIFTIAVTNGGPSDATNVLASDVIPAGFTYTGHDAGDFDTCTLTDDGAEEDPVVTAIDCELASLADGDTASFSLTLTVIDDAGSLSNTATAVADEQDPDGAEDEIVLDGNEPPTAGVTLYTLPNTGDPADLTTAKAPKANDVLRADITCGDEDNDSVSLAVLWKVQRLDDSIETVRTTTISAGQCSGTFQDFLDLSKPGFGDKGETIIIEVTPHDGIIDGPVAGGSTTVVIGDTSPTATNRIIYATVDEAKAIMLEGSDIDGEAVTFTITQQPETGSLAVNADSTKNCFKTAGTRQTRETYTSPGTETCHLGAIYTPAANFTGDVTFKYTVQNTDGGSTEATVTVRVSATATTGTAATNEANQATIQGALVSTGTTPTTDDPVTTRIIAVKQGTISIIEEPLDGDIPAPSGFSFFGQQIQISVKDSEGVDVTTTPANPMRFTFMLDASIVPEGKTVADIKVYRNGIEMSACTGGADLVQPTPACVLSKTLTGGAVQIDILTTAASQWNFSVPVAPAGGGGGGGPAPAPDPTPTLDPAPTPDPSPTVTPDPEHTELPGPLAVLKVHDPTPVRGSMIELTGRLRDCHGHEGTWLQLVAKIDGSDTRKKVAVQRLDEDCRTTYRIRANFKKAMFNVIWPQQDDDHKRGGGVGHLVVTHRLPGPWAVLGVSDHTPETGQLLTMYGRLRRCSGHTGTKIHLVAQIDGAKDFKRIATRKLNRECRAVFHVRADFERAVFNVIWPQQHHDHRRGNGFPHTVITHKPL